jgi:rhodanese-related sulfurtransferase
VLELQAKGFPQVACLLGGMDAWAKDGGAMVNASKPK